MVNLFPLTNYTSSFDGSSYINIIPKLLKISMNKIQNKNDLKYKSNRNLDENQIIWSSPKVENMFHTTNLDTIQYRIDECIEEKYITLDLKHLNLNKLPVLPNKITAKINI